MLKLNAKLLTRAELPGEKEFTADSFPALRGKSFFEVQKMVMLGQKVSLSVRTKDRVRPTIFHARIVRVEFVQHSCECCKGNGYVKLALEIIPKPEKTGAAHLLGCECSECNKTVLLLSERKKALREIKE